MWPHPHCDSPSHKLPKCQRGCQASHAQSSPSFSAATFATASIAQLEFSIIFNQVFIYDKKSCKCSYDHFLGTASAPKNGAACIQKLFFDPSD